MGDNRCRVWPRECRVCGRMVRQTNFMVRRAVSEVGWLEDTDTHRVKCHGWKVVPRHEWWFAERLSFSERIAHYYGAPGKPLVCVTCGSKELVLARPPPCATCREKASASETLKRLPVIPADPAIGEALAITEEAFSTPQAFSTPPHEPSAKCVDTCNNPLERKEEWDRWQGIARGLGDLREGRVKPWRQVREELDV